MVLAADEYAKRADFYEKAADDKTASLELRMVFARKANWFHILVRLEEKNKQSDQLAKSRQHNVAQLPGPITESVLEALLFSPRRLAAARRNWRNKLGTTPPRAAEQAEHTSTTSRRGSSLGR